MTIAAEDGKRFAFGENWARFLADVDDNRIASSKHALAELLGVESLLGKSFLDIGSGSGLSSLSALLLGAKVTSFDFDLKSVACTREIKRLYAPAATEWTVLQGSILDSAFIASLGMHDIVYSWGVLHHTGALWVGIENAISRVAPGGKLFIAVYNDQGWKSHLWWMIKKFYNLLPHPLYRGFGYLIGIGSIAANILKYTLLLRPMKAITPLLKRGDTRGMSVMHDMIDWVGGFPFEFATYETLELYMKARGFKLIGGRVASSLGCHQQVFERL